jgi:hypothetical protein
MNNICPYTKENCDKETCWGCLDHGFEQWW